MNENNKKISFYLNRTKAPLGENKKINNESESLALKRKNPAKSIILKQSTTTKLNTDVKNPDKLTNAHHQAMDNIFGPSKKDNAVGLMMSTINKRAKEDKDGSQTSWLVGVARYAFEDKVGSGTFGVVHKARDKKTLEVVAIKRVFQDKKYKNREL
jgi:hypothetical protein